MRRRYDLRPRDFVAQNMVTTISVTRFSNLGHTHDGVPQPVNVTKTHKVAGCAPVAEGATGEPLWDVVAAYLRD